MAVIILPGEIKKKKSPYCTRSLSSPLKILPSMHKPVRRRRRRRTGRPRSSHCYSWRKYIAADARRTLSEDCFVSEKCLTNKDFAVPCSMRPDPPLNGSPQGRCLGLVAWRTSVWRSSLRVDKQMFFFFTDECNTLEVKSVQR